MKKIRFLTLLMICCALSQARAQTSGSQAINVLVENINEISVSGAPGTLTIRAAPAGFQPDDATDSISTLGRRRTVMGE